MRRSLVSEADVHCSTERVFDTILDFEGQARWLGKSSAFRGTTAVSSNPAVLGTTYREPGPLGVRHGEVTVCERPTRITFHHPMTLKLGLGTIDVVVHLTLTARGESTHVHRLVTFVVPWPVKLVQPLVVLGFRRENARTLRALKAHADALGAART
ncbi:SRPBCC family protein [Solirubrobacter soli]|uniref:SRPBCC family protein n=1 Tax=Solirubrobacter soli TaxID=363832 RepID=UPI000406A5C6|nr:SRPBCC family protein [Solirubrobacter soli]